MIDPLEVVRDRKVRLAALRALRSKDGSNVSEPPGSPIMGSKEEDGTPIDQDGVREGTNGKPVSEDPEKHFVKTVEAQVCLKERCVLIRD